MLHTFYQAIQFPMQISENSLIFMDIKIHRYGEKIWIGMYSKLIQSDTFFFIPTIIKLLQKIVFCIARRYCTIVESSNIKKWRLEEFKSLLISQKYPKEIKKRRQFRWKFYVIKKKRKINKFVFLFPQITEITQTYSH